MNTIIYPDVDFNQKEYEKLNTDSIKVYDQFGCIDTDFVKISDVNDFKNADVIILTQNCIINGRYDSSNLKQACNTIKDYINDNTVIIFDTKTLPRTIKSMIKVLDEYELFIEINIAYTTYITDDTRIIAGLTNKALDTTKQLYKDTSCIKTTKHIQTAEIIPILQNIYLDTTIAIANQLAIFSEALTVDLKEAIDLSNIKDDINLLYPRAITENSIIRDSTDMIRLAEEYGEVIKQTESTRQTNDYVPFHIAYMAEKELYLKHKLSFFEIKVAILGVTTDDELTNPESNPSITLIDDIVQRDAEVIVHDSNVSKDLIEEHGARLIDDLDEIYECECIIIMTNKKEYQDIDLAKVEKILVTAEPMFDIYEYPDVDISCVGQYKIRDGETV